ncbi:23S rRNA (uracil(1939)-C(5))-methyltransferase RlmD [bacterium]|nr:23S rRNA (uracil(1939)-C(5))-methyltransferase RlmD [bacterium]
MRKSKPEVWVEVEVERAGAKGVGIARTEEGQVVFVKGGIPGDRVRAKVIKRKKQYLDAVLESVLRPSAHRIAPPCPHFGVCGGCSWQQMAYSEQLVWKEREVLDHLQRLGGLIPLLQDPILAAPEVYGYRNKLEFSFAAERWFTAEELRETELPAERRSLGFHAPGRWDKVLHLETCLLQADPSNRIRDFVHDYALKKQWSYYHPRNKTGFLRTLTVRIDQSGRIMLIVQAAENRKREVLELVEALAAEIPGIASVWWSYNPGNHDSVYALDLEHLFGAEALEETMSDYRGGAPLRFRIGPKSFYQTNSVQAAALYRIALDFAQIEADTLVYDLYTGTGTLALFAARVAGKVVGIEGVEAAVEDARNNALLNGIDNAVFCAGDMRKVLDPSFVAEHGRPSVVITDPPREGMHPDVVQSLLEMQPERIVYVSCNSATQARDLAVLCEAYELSRLQAVDMFPQTAHVESVVLLCRKSEEPL